MSTLKAQNLQNPSAGSPAIVLASDGTATAQLSSVNGGPLAGARNRVINGDMRIDARNNGASVSINAPANIYTVDRWSGYGQTADGVFTVQRSSVAPVGFTNSALITVTTADASIGAAQVYSFSQCIEGLNTADFGFGAAGAQSVTISFWVRSSITGTYSATLFNSAYNRGYTATFAINAANTFEYKTLTIAGDVTGTWLTDTGVGFRLWIALGTGSTYKGTAGAWNAGTTYGATGQVDLISTNGATFYITGVQLEAGSVATPFERRSYGQELALCQRYYQHTIRAVKGGRTDTGVGDYWAVQFPVQMRAAPTMTQRNLSLVGSATGLSVTGATADYANLTISNTSGGSNIASADYSAASEL